MGEFTPEDFFVRNGRRLCLSCGDTWTEHTFAFSCMECGHAWLNSDDLVRHDFRTRRSIAARDEANGGYFGPFTVLWRGVEDILVCPCCGHDL